MRGPHQSEGSAMLLVIAVAMVSVVVVEESMQEETLCGSGGAGLSVNPSMGA